MFLRGSESGNERCATSVSMLRRRDFLSDWNTRNRWCRTCMYSSMGTMDGSSPDDDCCDEQEREGDENPGVSEPRMVKAFMRTQSFAMPSPGNLVRSRRLSRSLIIRAQRSNRRVRAGDLITGAATVDFMSQAFGVLNQGTARLLWRTRPRHRGFQMCRNPVVNGRGICVRPQKSRHCSTRRGHSPHDRSGFLRDTLP